jgi:hypothetical protein
MKSINDYVPEMTQSYEMASELSPLGAEIKNNVGGVTLYNKFNLQEKLKHVDISSPCFHFRSAPVDIATRTAWQQATNYLLIDLHLQTMNTFHVV